MMKKKEEKLEKFRLILAKKLIIMKKLLLEIKKENIKKIERIFFMVQARKYFSDYEKLMLIFQGIS